MSCRPHASITLMPEIRDRNGLIILVGFLFVFGIIRVKTNGAKFSYKLDCKNFHTTNILMNTSAN